MGFEEFIAVLLTVLGALGAKELLSRYLASKTKQAEEFVAFDQKSQSNALTSTLNISQKSIDHLISLSNGQLASLRQAIDSYRESDEKEAKEFRQEMRAEMSIFRAEIATELGKLRDGQTKIQDEIRPLVRQIADLKTQMTVVNRDWHRFDEIVGDIDLTLHRIEVAVGIKDDN